MVAVASNEIAAWPLEAKCLQLRALWLERPPVGAFVAMSASLDDPDHSAEDTLACCLRANQNLPAFVAASSSGPGRNRTLVVRQDNGVLSYAVLRNADQMVKGLPGPKVDGWEFWGWNNPDGTEAAVTGVSTKNGEIASAVYLLDLNNSKTASPFAAYTDNLLFSVAWVDAETPSGRCRTVLIWRLAAGRDR